jgi:hypothetical protein
MPVKKLTPILFAEKFELVPAVLDAASGFIKTVEVPTAASWHSLFSSREARK